MDRAQSLIALAPLLLRWYRRSRRDVPFRRTRDPYAIWVSEVMLQQTTVRAVTPRWERFLARFPSVDALAAAPEEAVLAEWAGLGYYARARNLHRAARAVAEAGSFPSSAAALLRLPGVGAYTAAAVASIAFGERVAVLDGNVARVLSRLFAKAVDPKSGSGRRALQALADALVPARHAGDHNQALMELGATVCLPSNPRCADCPVASRCEAFRRGAPERFPSRRRARPTRQLRLVAGLARRRGRVVVARDVHTVAGAWSLPLFSPPKGSTAAAALRRAWPRACGRAVAGVVPLGSVRHSVLDRRYVVELAAVTEGARLAPASVEIRAVAEARLPDLVRGSLLEKLLALERRSGATRRDGAPGPKPARARGAAPPRPGRARPRRPGG